MKKGALFIAATLMLMVVLMACAPRTGTVVETPAPVATTAPVASPLPAATMKPAASAVPGAVTGVSERISGVVSNKTADTITVQTDDGKMLTFGITAVAVPTEEIQAGQRVEVYYTGTIAGTDTTGATVTQVQVIS